MSVIAMILAGGEGPALSVLTALRSEAAVPFGGKYRIIDFALSNCVNSDIFNVAVLTQYQPRSLNEHIGVGRPWDLDRTAGGVRLLQPYQRNKGERGAWQEGTADALRFNLDVIPASVEDVLILAGDHVYIMDYRPLIRFHHSREADVTIAVRQVPAFEAHRFGMVAFDPDGRVVEYEEKPKRTRFSTASMGVYVFRREVLIETLTTGPGRRHHNLGGEVMPALVRSAKVYAYPFQGYWADVGTLQAYYEANMALLGETPALDLYVPDWVIHTRSEERPAVYLGPESRVERALLCDGCQIEGTVINSVISPGVRVAAGAVVRDSIVMTDTVIEAGAVVDRAIIDKRVTVGANARVGVGEESTPNQKWPERINTGITVIGKRATIPAGITIGRNVVIAPHVTAQDFPGLEVASGETIGR
ncbi:MAG: glucose-1-phosphate adenylyltransferase subunit GlgD [Anaerolineae bacterium]